MKFKSFILLIFFVFAGLFAYAQEVAPENKVDAQDNSNGAASLSKGYTLGPGDQVAGRVLGETEYDFVANVDENGMIEVPFVKRPIVAGCKTERELRTELTEVLKTYLRDPQFSFRISEKHSRPTVSVAGEINKQMEIILTRKATLIEMLSVAGGIKEEASGQIQVTRPKTPMCMAENDPDNWKADSNTRTYSYANMQIGNDATNPTIYPGDVIHVMKAPPIYINGEVVGAQPVLLKEKGLSLAGALGMVGGSRPGADIKNIAIYRLKPGSGPEAQNRDLISANLKLIREGKQEDIMLRPYDLIVVDKTKKSIGVIIAEMALKAARDGASSFTNVIPYRIIY